MKKFAAIIAALMVMAVLVSAVSAANNTTNATVTTVSGSAATNTTVAKVDIRSPVFTGASLAATLPVNVDYTTFPGFYYDIDANIGSESLSIDGSKITGVRTLAEDGLVYTSTVQQVKYKYDDWTDTYPKMGFLAEEYVPVNGKPDVLSKLILDNDDKYSLKVGQSLDLGEGYSLVPKQIDTDGKKVWLDLVKDGKTIDNQVINADTGNKTWTYEQDDVGGENDVPIMRVHVDSVFQGQTDSMVVIKGLWLASSNPIKIESDKEFDILKVKSIGTNNIVLRNKDTVNFNKNKDLKIAGDMNLKVADTDDVRYYFYKSQNASGAYEVRGPVQTGPYTWDFKNFPGFYYDIDSNIGSESLQVAQINGRTIPEDGLVYTSTVQQVKYKYDDWTDTYPKMGFLAQEYVPVNGKPDVLSKLILDNDHKYSLKVGESLDLGEGYSLVPKQIDTDGKKVWLDLVKDGKTIDNQVINADTGNKTWTYEQDDVGGENDVPIMRVHVDSVFQGQTDSMVVIKGLWLASSNPIKIESDKEFGSLKVKSIGTNNIVLRNKDSITLNKNKDVSLGNNMFFKVADSDTLRYYPYAKYTSAGTVAPGATTPATPGNNTTPGAATPGPAVRNNTSVNVTPGHQTPVTPGHNNTSQVPPANNTTKRTPGFEAIFAVAGLIAVAYLVRRK